MSVQQPVRGTVVPTLRYRDLPAAIDWLCTAFGFEEQMAVAGEDGSVRYAQLAFGDGLVMLGAVEDNAAGRLMAQPEQTGGLETQLCYVCVKDTHAHCARARAAGAAIVLDVDDPASGGRGYSCRDPEGHVWTFGTYDPRQRRLVLPRYRATPLQVAARRLALVVGLVANIVGSAAFLGWVSAVNGPAVVVPYASLPSR
ncbi:MAG TPA: VOC family protein [Hyphomicrobiaceae bacterium]|nr:VOC family protein [Hyphomicrobiaceae bacterium]